VIVTVDCDAHAYAFDGLDGHPSLIEVAEAFGVLVEDVTDEIWGERALCWVYRFTGPQDNVRRAIDEYWGEGTGAEYLPEQQASACGDLPK
jgi:hypothetical protein